MKFIPILFSTMMVQALLADRKTMTRRLVKGDALKWLEPDMFTPEFVADAGNSLSPYGYAGDVLWGRETYLPMIYDPKLDPDPWSKEPFTWYLYRADFTAKQAIAVHYKWRPSIFMTKQACRIFLENTVIHVERLHDISDEDCIAEGIEPIEPGGGIFLDYKDIRHYGSGKFGLRRQSFVSPRDSFKSLWIAINGQESWDSNPWVWANRFKQIETPKNFIVPPVA